MTQREFAQILESLPSLSPEQSALLRRELESAMGSPLPSQAKQADTPAEATVYDVMEKAGLIGRLKGNPGTPTDLSTNPKHMEGFGHG